MKKDKQRCKGIKRPFIYLLLPVTVFFLSGCGSSSSNAVPKAEQEWENLRIKNIEFVCDQHINQGMLLPVDVIYITKFHMPREVIAIGPNSWFESLKRERWEARQTLSLRGGETRKLALNRLWLKDTKLLIVFANFKNVEEPLSQQIVIDHTANKRVRILVLPQSMMVDQTKVWLDFGN